MPLLEAIEQRAPAAGVEVDARVARGRTYRDALRRLLDEEHFDRVIVSAGDSPRRGLSGEDLSWLLDRVPAEVLILRPAPEDTAPDHRRRRRRTLLKAPRSATTLP